MSAATEAATHARNLRAEVEETARVLAEHRQIKHTRQLLKACQAAHPYLDGIPKLHNQRRIADYSELLETLVFSISMTQAVGGVWSDGGHFIAVPPMRLAA